MRIGESGRVDHEEAVPLLGELVGAPCATAAAALSLPLGMLGLGPALPRGDRPVEEALRLVDHRGLPRAAELPPELVVDGDRLLGDDLEEVARRAHRHVDLLVRVRLALDAGVDAAR